ncbi:MAG: dTMP kinase [Armatimonadota bacterium]|nr:dTMP kinase [Armatimonadota bacterium]MDR5696312.1 dTMP kinase [Armatimonadota bacterium]
MRGVFISLEGPEGAGKTTQQQRLASRLRAAGYDVFVTREPGGTAIGEQIRRILLDASHARMAPQTEMLLFAASRAQFVAEMVRPALEMGKIVLSDRYVHASLAYQGYARGLGVDLVRAVNDVATGGLLPDLVILLDVPPDLGLRRALEGRDAAADRMEREDLEFHERVREGFLRLAAEDPRIRLITGTDDPDEIAERIWREVEQLLKAKGRWRQADPPGGMG